MRKKVTCHLRTRFHRSLTETFETGLRNKFYLNRETSFARMRIFSRRIGSRYLSFPSVSESAAIGFGISRPVDALEIHLTKAIYDASKPNVEDSRRYRCLNEEYSRTWKEARSESSFGDIYLRTRWEGLTLRVGGKKYSIK